MTTTDLAGARETLVQSYRIRPVWAFLHDAVAHPLLALTGCAHWAVRFHDWTSRLSYDGNPPD